MWFPPHPNLHPRGAREFHALSSAERTRAMASFFSRSRSSHAARHWRSSSARGGFVAVDDAGLARGVLGLEPGIAGVGQLPELFKHPMGVGNFVIGGE